MRAAIGIDVGGTFTDLVAVDEGARVTARKVLSTPSDQSEGVVDALQALNAPAVSVERITHGTTVATNTLLERRGARVVLCATRGATDLLTLRRQDRAALYDLARHHPLPLVARSDSVAVPERVAPEGVLEPLTDAAAMRVAEDVAARAPEIVAVALLHAHANPAHERRLAAALAAALPGVDVVLSSEVLPEIREFERTSTTVAEAYLRPRVAGYLRRLGERLAAAGYPVPGVVTSSGGTRSATEASRSAAALALSGPAGGVVGAALVARAAGFSDALTIDIGGTSADAGLVLAGEPLVEPGGEVAGVPITLPRVLVETVSAGGGSVAWIDDGGALRVGPRSAGVVPGPVAFGRGGREPTVTDAHVVLETIRETRLSGGVSLNAPAARGALETLARRLGASATRAATAMIAIADAEMARALRRVSVERGVDPRRCVLVAFGGGGPLHACGLADRLGMSGVLVPPFAGVLSALGLAVAPERREAMASALGPAESFSAPALATLFGALSARTGRAASAESWLRARYAGQGHELDVAVHEGEDGLAVAGHFVERHQARFGFRLDRGVELVSARHAAIGPAREVRLARRGAERWNSQSMRDDGGMLDAVVRGPASVALSDATMYVAEGWTARALAIGGWMLERE
jgi:N-methylhydantoinase A